ncbi:MAG TPA: YiiX family permuted papain-like enzyme [Dongiaceae bacterium]|jgi:hypothetical protein|nr:YiiX family permuted papain-like enzyme [Dongiaceae bacterium]
MPSRAGKSRLRALLPYAGGAVLLFLFCAAYFLRRKIWIASQLALVSMSTSGLPVHDGDLIFQTSRSAQSYAVQQATGSPYSHMGLVFIRDGEPYVLEASATVRYTPLARWIVSGVGHHFVVKRLIHADQLLTSTAMDKVKQSAATFIGHPYDLTFEWSDERIYCSELVWKIYDRSLRIQIGTLQQIKDFDLSDPVVAALMKQRYGAAVPLTETVISPVAMFNSPLLAEATSQ